MAIESLPLQPGDWGPLSQHLIAIETITTGGSLPDIVIGASGANAVATSQNSAVTISGVKNGDPATVFQNAINALKNVGGIIHFRGSFTFTSGITLYPGMGLIGQGPMSAGNVGANVISATSAVTGPIITVVNDPGNATWTFFPYLANFTLFGTHPQTAQDGIYVSNANGTILDAFVSFVEIFDVGGNGLTCDTACKLYIDNCYFEHCQQNGIRDSAGSTRVSGSYFLGNGLYGIDSTSAGQLQVSECWFRLNVSGAFLCWSMGSNAQIDNNYFEDNGTAGGLFASRMQSISGAARGMITGNVWRDTRGGSAVANFIDTDNSGVSLVLIDANTFSGQSGTAIRLRNNNAGSKKVITNNMGFNDTVGKITNPFHVNGTVGLIGNLAAPVASTDYAATEVSLLVTSTGGTGVSITLKDPQGNTVASGLTTLTAQPVPLGYKLNFGAFSVAPTTTAFVT